MNMRLRENPEPLRNPAALSMLMSVATQDARGLEVELCGHEREALIRYALADGQHAVDLIEYAAFVIETLLHALAEANGAESPDDIAAAVLAHRDDLIAIMNAEPPAPE